MALAMESKDLFVGRQDSDDVVITRFGLLLGQIKTWSVPFADLEKIITQKDLYGARIQAIRRVMPGRSNLDQILHRPKNVRLFVRGWVGLVVSKLLFRTLPSGQHHGPQGEDIWMDQAIALSFLQMENRLFYADRKAITLRDLHDWRALTAGLVSRLHATSKPGKGMESQVTDCSRVIMRLIGSWVNLDTRETLKKGLLGILLQAVDFSKVLRCQRASWSVRHVDLTSDAGMVFNEAIMDNRHGDDDSGDDDSMSRYQKLVEIVVSPGLFKRGNTDGERFEVESCLARAEVRCYSKLAKTHQ
ncbi:hypothetical protein MMC07_006357 [Pseudocyphellaria aurata]|nr:hypothetical protein [Pseudocyphellaria aurata]